MIVPDTLYRYVDTNLTEYVVTGAELEDRGEWSDVVIYERLNAVSFEGCLYVALQTVSTTPPTAVVDENWSSLVIISAAGGGVVTAGSDAYARQQAALLIHRRPWWLVFNYVQTTTDIWS